jgi:hypothetical protein
VLYCNMKAKLPTLKTPRNRLPFETLIVAHLLKKFAPFIESEGSVPHKPVIFKALFSLLVVCPKFWSVYLSSALRMLHVLPSRPPKFHHSNIWWRLQIIELPFIVFSNLLLLSLRSKYTAQLSVLSVWVESLKFHTHTKQLVKLQFCIFSISPCLIKRRENKRF